MNDPVTYHTKSTEETQEIAKNLAKELTGGTVLALSGDLGSGKTTFTQGLGRALGIEKVNSPTFVILRSYDVRNKIQDVSMKTLYHIDLYRTQTEHDIEGIGLDEIFQDQEAIVVIEWPEKLGDMLPEKRVDIRFEYINENERKITIENHKSQKTNSK